MFRAHELILPCSRGPACFAALCCARDWPGSSLLLTAARGGQRHSVLPCRTTASSLNLNDVFPHALCDGSPRLDGTTPSPPTPPLPTTSVAAASTGLLTTTRTPLTSRSGRSSRTPRRRKRPRSSCRERATSASTLQTTARRRKRRRRKAGSRGRKVEKRPQKGRGKGNPPGKVVATEPPRPKERRCWR